jgi:hypothetical protein
MNTRILVIASPRCSSLDQPPPFPDHDAETSWSARRPIVKQALLRGDRRRENLHPPGDALAQWRPISVKISQEESMNRLAPSVVRGMVSGYSRGVVTDR